MPGPVRRASTRSSGPGRYHCAAGTKRSERGASVAPPAEKVATTRAWPVLVDLPGAHALARRARLRRGARRADAARLDDAAGDRPAGGGDVDVDEHALLGVGLRDRVREREARLRAPHDGLRPLGLREHGVAAEADDELARAGAGERRRLDLEARAPVPARDGVGDVRAALVRERQREVRPLRGADRGLRRAARDALVAPALPRGVAPVEAQLGGHGERLAVEIQGLRRRLEAQHRADEARLDRVHGHRQLRGVVELGGAEAEHQGQLGRGRSGDRAELTALVRLDEELVGAAARQRTRAGRGGLARAERADVQPIVGLLGGRRVDRDDRPRDGGAGVVDELPVEREGAVRGAGDGVELGAAADVNAERRAVRLRAGGGPEPALAGCARPPEEMKSTAAATMTPKRRAWRWRWEVGPGIALGAHYSG